MRLKCFAHSLIVLVVLLFASPALAGTTYYVDCTDAGTNSGTFANPWQSIDDVNDASMSSGDDVYFKENTTCTLDASDDKLAIDWTGTSGDRVIIGCYDGNGDFSCDNVTQGSDTDQKPTLAGAQTYPTNKTYGLINVEHGVSPSNDYFGWADADSSGGTVMEDDGQGWSNNALVGGIIQNKSDVTSTGATSDCVITSNDSDTVTCSGGLSGGSDNTWDSGDEYHISMYNYITIKDLKISLSNGKGVRLQDADYGLIDNVYIYRARRSGITLVRSHDSTVSDCVAEYPGYQRSLTTVPGITLTGSHSLDSTNNNLVTRNRVWDGDGEGISTYQGANYNTIEYNVVYDSDIANYYQDACKGNIWRYNLGYGSENPTHGNTPHSCYAQTIENIICNDGNGKYDTGQGYNSDTEVYGNLFANCKGGIRLSRSGNADCHDGDNNLFYNNTVVDNDTNFVVTSDSDYSGNEWKNNISANYWGGSNTEIDNCTATGSTFANNLWDGTESGDCITSAQNNADPGLSITSGWRSLSAGNVDGTKFALVSTSDAIDTGADLGASYDDTITPLTGLDFTASPIAIVTHDQDAYGAGWEIGGLLFYDDTAPTITDPTPNETDWDYVTPDTMDITYNGTGTHYATYWKVVLPQSDCDDGAAQGTEVTCDTTLPLQHAYAALSGDSSYKLCVWTIEDLDGGTDCDSWEKSIAASQLFSTVEVGIAEGVHDAYDTCGDADDCAQLEDEDAGWTIDYYINWTVNNITDGSTCVVTDNDATHVQCTLAGGTDNDWDIGDEYSFTPQPSAYGIIVSEADLGVDGVGTPPYDHYGIHVSEADLGTDGTNHYGLTVSQ